MKLSIIIVNCNNGDLLKQTLKTLISGCSDIDYELIIVDNASVDQSVNIINQEYPFANVIANKVNIGFAKANNQALQAASGEYVLLVKPDAISTTESVSKILDFMDQHQDTGGLSLRMLTPQGRFIPESIHGLTPSWAAFLKFIGFAKYLTRTRLYDRTRKDWVEEFRITEIDILNDACMILRKSVLSQTGYFDERFSRYGYNIDLSYRIRLAGYKNYYFPKVYIIKFENKAFVKFSWRHIKYYYGAMVMFALKYLVRLPELKISNSPHMLNSGYEVK